MHRIRPRQLRLSFPLTFQDIAFPAGPPPGLEATIRERQPKKFPRGWFALSLSDPDWRAKHYASWSASRKLQGLPHVVEAA